VLNKAIIGIMLATAVVMWIFVPNPTSAVFVVLGIAAIALASARKNKNHRPNNPSSSDSTLQR
jgi:hypothetical protein